MNISGLALNEIIVRVLHESAECKTKLEVEESGREVAKLQGLVSGYRVFLNFLAAEFYLSQSMLEYNGDKGFDAPKLSDAALYSYQADIAAMKESESWINVLARIEANTSDLKNHLLFGAEKSRDLDYSQGQYKATTFYTTFFDAIVNEVGRREREREEHRKTPGLFDDEEAAQYQEGQYESEEFKEDQNILQFSQQEAASEILQDTADQLEQSFEITVNNEEGSVSATFEPSET